MLAEQHLAAKKPGTGIPAARLSELIGLRLRRDVQADELLRDEDVDNERTRTNQPSPQVPDARYREVP